MKTRFVPLLLALGIGNGSGAEPFTNVIDGFATNITAEFVVGNTAPYNFLLITNGGAMTNLGRVLIGNAEQAHNNTAIATGTGSFWDTRDQSYLGLRSASNTLAVLEGARVFTGTFEIGSHASASNNYVRVAGVGSRLRGSILQFGNLGVRNRLLVEDGAALEFGEWIFNAQGGFEHGQVATARGAGTLCALSGSLRINGSHNMLELLDGVETHSFSSTIGTTSSTGNQVVIAGRGTYWRNHFGFMIGGLSAASNVVVVGSGAECRFGGLTLGQAGTDNLCTVETGGLLGVPQAMVGEQSSARRNGLLVVGNGSALSNVLMTIGQAGSDNFFTVSSGAIASLGDFAMGMQFTSSNNQAMASGTNTLWIANRLTIGSAGDFNTLNVEDGANVFASSLLSGGQGGAGNMTRVNGALALLSLTNALDISGENMLVVSNRARVESGSGVVGSYGVGSAALIDNASWSNAHSLTVGGQASDAVLRVVNNGRLSSSNVVIGAGDHADRNRVEVSGKGSAWQVLGNLSVGSWGDSNELAVSNAGRLTTANLAVGGFFVPVPPAIFPGDANIARIQGANTVVNVSSNITLGYEGSGNRIELRGGAQLTSSSVEVATRARSTDNSILISDPGTRWGTTNTLLLGSNGYRSSLVVSNGGRLTTGSTILGDGGFQVVVGGGICTNRFGFNSVVVAGTGTVWEVGRQLIIGRNSTSNYVTVSDGATLRAHEIMAGFFGTACLPQEYENEFLLDGGHLVVSNRIFVGPRGKFRMLGGRADVESFWVETGPPGRALVLGGTLRPRSMYASAPAEIEIGDGIRRATLELLGGNYFSSGRIIVAPNSVIAGRGSINATNAGTYGTLRAITAITNSSLQGSSGFDVWIAQTGPGTGHSLLSLGPTFGPPAILEGRLRVALSPSFQPQASNDFPIVMFASATGEFLNAPDNSRIKTVDNLSSFLVRYMPNAVLLSDHRSTDLDGDLIEDAWATNYFGHSPLAPVERLSDSDGDGMSNYDEFRAGTDPTNSSSALRVSATVTQGRVTLRWPCVDGKSYRIYFSSDMRAWREVSEPTFAFPEAGVCEWTSDGSGAQMQFYRVAVE